MDKELLASGSEREKVISVSGLKKMYKLYNKPSDRLLDAFGIKKNNYTVNYALKGIDLDVYKGETVGIIGTNGSGKSTLLKIITGVLNPTEGDVQVNGRISALLELGAGFNQEYNGIENVYLNGTMMGFTEKEIEKRLPEILAFADIGDYVYQPVKTYSSGMFVRLAFAVAINIDPEILIVDEALSVGDVFFQAKCYHKFEEFKKSGKTILFVSHDLSSISKYCDRAVLLNKGVLIGEGTPKKMIDIYKQVLVGQYPLSDEKNVLLDDPEIRKAAEGADGDVNGNNPGEKPSEVAGRASDALEYGNGAAKIADFFVTDSNGIRSNSIIKGTDFTIHMKVEFLRNVSAPIFAMSFKNVLGIEITGTNSMFEKAYFDPAKAGDVKYITFTQNMSLQGGEYLLSFGVTGFEQDKFVVYHRLYDVFNISVVSDKNTVGYYDMNSICKVSDADAETD